MDWKQRSVNMEEKNYRIIRQLVVKIVFPVSPDEIEKIKSKTKKIWVFFPMLAQIITRLQMTFASTLRKYKHDLDLLVKGTWAIFWHKYSTNEDPRHDLCNIDWCGYLKSVHDGMPYDHKPHSLPRPVLDAIKPVFDNLCSRESLARVVNGGSQNPNEGFHSLVWLMSPKHKASSGTTFQIACSIATTIFNDGYYGLGESIQITSPFFHHIIVNDI